MKRFFNILKKSRRARFFFGGLFLLLVLLGVALGLSLTAQNRINRFAAALVSHDYEAACTYYKQAGKAGQRTMDKRIAEVIASITDLAETDTLHDNDPHLKASSLGSCLTPSLQAATEDALARYIEKETLTAPQLSRILGTYERLSPGAVFLAEARQRAGVFIASRESFARAEQTASQDDFLAACQYYAQVPAEDSLYYSRAQEGFSANAEKLSVNAITRAESLSQSYQYTRALALLDGALQVLSTNADFVAKASDCRDAITATMARDLVAYEGDIEHIFTRNLIAYPRITEAHPMAQSLFAGHLTVPEFTYILNSLYEKGYVLVDIDQVLRREDGSLGFAQPLRLPAGKKPLLLSLDITYNITENGIANRLLYTGGKYMAETTFSGGDTEVRADTDAIALLESFIATHPDFSFDGARGILCVTGYSGLFGYETSTPGTASYQELLSLVNALRADGWRFACQSYGYLGLGNASESTVRRDISQWKQEIAPICGQTSYFAWPLGDRAEEGSDAYTALADEGFSYFMGIGSLYYTQRQNDGAVFFQDRRPLDGTALTEPVFIERYTGLFDAAAARDSARPRY